MQSKGIQAWLILIVLSLIWGSSFILIKKGLIAFSPQQQACLRIVISAMAFSPFFLKYYKEIPAGNWKYLLVVGLTGSAIPAYLFALAETVLSSSVASVMNSLTPMWTLLIGIFVFRKKLSFIELGGILAGLGGSWLLLRFGQQSASSFNLFYGAMILLATICYAISGNVVDSRLRGLNSLKIGAASFSLTGPPALLYLLAGTDFINVMQTHHHAWASLGFITILALFSTVIASLIYFKLVHISDAVFASMISYLVPIVGIGWGFLDGEVISIFHFLAMGLILGGVYLTKFNKK